MILKYIDLHNKTLRDAKDPLETAELLRKHGYFIVGVSVHNDENEIKGEEHFYNLFEHHFERLEKVGILILPTIEIKIRKENYEELDKFVDHFHRKYIPVRIKGNVHHIPFLIMVHGGKKEVNSLAAKNPKIDLICHPEKDDGYFSEELAEEAAKNNIGIEVNYREYHHSENKDGHVDKVCKLIDLAHKVGTKLFLSTAAISNDEIVHIKELFQYGHKIHPSLVDESVINTVQLIEEKYKVLLDDISFNIDIMRKRHEL